MTENADLIQSALPDGRLQYIDTLKAQLEIYQESILLRTFDNKTTSVRTISADEIAHAFIEHMGMTTGILPENAVWWNQGPNGQMVALWREPRVWPVALQREPFAPPDRLRLPMPGLLFLCSPARAPWLFAATQRPTGREDILYHAPTFNIFANGRTCPGSHRFPMDISLIPESFFESFFSMTGSSRDRSQKHPTNLLALWDELNGADSYPTDDLVPIGTVGGALALSENGRPEYA